MLRAFALAVAQLFERRILAILVKSMAITLAIFAALGVGVQLAIGSWQPTDDAGYLTALLIGVGLILALWFLFRFVALAVLQLFGDEVVRAVEARHYPSSAAAARPLGWHEELRAGLRNLGRSLGYNLLALPVALALAVTGIGTVLVFGAVNAVLLGRELTEMVALRHRTADGTAPLPGFATRTALGAIVVALLLVPVVNLFAPLIGAAMATHLVHAKDRTAHAA